MTRPPLRATAPLAPADHVALAQELMLRWRKWDAWVEGRNTIAKVAVVLSRDAHAEVASVSRRLWRLFDEARARYHRDPGLRDAVDLPAPLRGAAATSRHRDDRSPRFARLDLFLTDHGWVTSEINADVPGGHNEAMGLGALFATRTPGARNPTASLLDACARALLSRTRSQSPAVGLVFATGYAEDLQVASLVSDAFSAAGARVVLGNPDNLRFADGRCELFGQPLDAVWRYYPGDWLAELRHRKTLVPALARAELLHTNPWDALAMQSKNLFAALHDARHGWSSEARALIDAHVPETRRLDTTSAEHALRDREHFVIKEDFGRVGAEVYMGAEWDAQDWGRLVAACLRSRRRHTVQRRFEPRGIAIDGVPHRLCLGVYLLDGEPVGYYGRLAAGLRVAYDALNCAVLVDSDGGSA